MNPADLTPGEQGVHYVDMRMADCAQALADELRTGLGHPELNFDNRQWLQRAVDRAQSIATSLRDRYAHPTQQRRRA